MPAPLLLGTIELARLLEATEASVSHRAVDLFRAARPDLAPTAIAVAGGHAFFYGARSPLSQAIGIGMNGAVSEDEFRRLEDFFLSRGAPIILSLCPLADASVLLCIGRSSYRISHFEHTLVRTVEDIQRSDVFRVRRVLPEEDSIGPLPY